MLSPVPSKSTTPARAVPAPTRGINPAALAVELLPESVIKT